MPKKQASKLHDPRGERAEALKLRGDLTIINVKTTTTSGDGITVFRVHTDCLQNRSTLLDHTTSPSSSAFLSIVHKNPAVVEGYLSYLYTGKLPCKGQCVSTASYEFQYSWLVDFYVFGQRFGDTQLKHDALDAILATHRDHVEQQDDAKPSIALMNYVYEQAYADQPLRNLLVEMYSLYSDASDLKDPSLHHDVVRDVGQIALSVLCNHRDLPTPETASSHDYLKPEGETEQERTSIDGEEQSETVASGSTKSHTARKKRKRRW